MKDPEGSTLSYKVSCHKIVISVCFNSCGKIIFFFFLNIYVFIVSKGRTILNLHIINYANYLRASSSELWASKIK